MQQGITISVLKLTQFLNLEKLFENPVIKEYYMWQTACLVFNQVKVDN